MNPLDSNHHDCLLFDRLADGELNGEEYRRLLTSLDERPDGWKRCALALLEAQALRRELGGTVPGRETAIPVPASETTRPGRAQPQVNLATLSLAVSVSFLLAFGLGAWLRGGLSSFPRPLAGNPAPADSSAATASTSSRESPQQSPAATAGDQTGTRVSPAPLPRGSMTLVVNNGSGQGEKMQLPVYDINQIDDSWLQPSPMPQDVVEKLQASGLQLKQQRRMVPFEVDGQQVIVPMDEVELVPVSIAYQ